MKTNVDCYSRLSIALENYVSSQKEHERHKSEHFLNANDAFWDHYDMCFYELVGALTEYAYKNALLGEMLHVISKEMGGKCNE